jgi:hypothetical protein
MMSPTYLPTISIDTIMRDGEKEDSRQVTAITVDHTIIIAVVTSKRNS